GVAGAGPPPPPADQRTFASLERLSHPERTRENGVGACRVRTADRELQRPAIKHRGRRTRPQRLLGACLRPATQMGAMPIGLGVLLSRLVAGLRDLGDRSKCRGVSL